MRATLLLLAILILLLLQAVEVWRRVRDPAALTVGQFWRRIVTATILEIALLMWLVGEPVLRHQPPLTQLAYWSAALLLVFAAAFAAIREMGEVSRRYYRQRADLFRGTGPEGPGGGDSEPTRGRPRCGP